MINRLKPHSSFKPFIAILGLTLMACTTATPAPTASAGRLGTGGRAVSAPTAIPAQSITAQSIITVDGSLALSSPALSLGFDAAGKVLTVNAAVGQMVKRGDVLATIDDTALQDAIVDAQATLDALNASITQQTMPASKADLAAAGASLNSAYSNYTTIKNGSLATDIAASRKSVEIARLGLDSSQASRDLTCGGKGGTSSQSCKQAEASLGNAYEGWISAQDALTKLLTPPSVDSLTQANAGIVSAKAKLETLKTGISDAQRKINDTQIVQSKAALQRAKDALITTKLFAPCDCIVQEVNIATGSTASSSAFTLVSLGGLQFKTTNVSERDIARLKNGSTASIRLRAYPDPITGRVSTSLAQSSGTQGNTATYTVLLDLDSTSKFLLPGMTGQADVSVPALTGG